MTLFGRLRLFSVTIVTPIYCGNSRTFHPSLPFSCGNSRTHQPAKLRHFSAFFARFPAKLRHLSTAPFGAFLDRFLRHLAHLFHSLVAFSDLRYSFSVDPDTRLDVLVIQPSCHRRNLFEPSRHILVPWQCKRNHPSAP